MFGLSARQIFLLVLLVFALFAGAQYVPVYFRALQFNDFIRGETKYAASMRKSTEQLRTVISERAKELKIPIGPKDIHITRRGPAFQLELDYSFPIDLRIYQHTLSFHVSEAGEIFEK
jgi:hypothetical protein